LHSFLIDILFFLDKYTDHPGLPSFPTRRSSDLGASMLEGLVLVSAIRDRMAHGLSKRAAIEQARLARLRPVLMTGMVAALGFLRSEEHTSELQSLAYLVCRLLLEKKNFLFKVLK